MVVEELSLLLPSLSADALLAEFLWFMVIITFFTTLLLSVKKSHDEYQRVVTGVIVISESQSSLFV